MSLINQMLQDLEKRRASSAERAGVPDQVRALPPNRNSRAWWLWWALGVGLAALVTPAVMDWYQRDWPAGKEAQQSPAPTPQPPVPASPSRPAGDAGAIEPPAPIAARLALELERVPVADAGTRAAATPAADTPAPRSSDKSPRTQPLPAGQAMLPRDQPMKPGALTPEAAQRGAAAPAVQGPTAGESALPATTPASASTSYMHTPGTLPQPVPPAASVKLVARSAAPQSAAGKVAAGGQEADTKSGAQTVTASTRTALAPATELKADAPLPISRAKIHVHAQADGDTQQATPQIDKRLQQLSPQQIAENDYRKAIALLNQGRVTDAQDSLRLALVQNPMHAGARQALFGLLLDAKKHGQAEQVLQDGLRLDPARPGFAMALARLQVERGDIATAVETLQKTAPAAHDSPDYLAFLAALLQRQARHDAAIDHYEAALRLAPNSGVWLMGLGISLQAINRNNEAQSAFRRARATNTLNPELQAFVDQRLRQLQ